jgi:hypothetical protein
MSHHFADFSLRLPGFSLQVTKYIDEKNHVLRYTLKNRKTGDVYFVVIFTLLLNGTDEEINSRNQPGTEDSHRSGSETNPEKPGKSRWESESSSDIN